MQDFKNTAVPQIFIKNALEALKYYESLGIEAFNVIKDIEKNRLFHANLTYADCIFYLNEGDSTQGGIALMVKADEDNISKVIKLFEKLEREGKVVHAIERTPRNHLYGSLIDKFGISWQIRSFVLNVPILNLYPLHLPQLLEMGFTKIAQVPDKDGYHIPDFIKNHESIFGVEKLDNKFLISQTELTNKYQYSIIDNFDKPREADVLRKFSNRVVYSDYGWLSDGYSSFNYIDQSGYKWEYGFDAFKQWKFLINSLLRENLLNEKLANELFDSKKELYVKELTDMKQKLKSIMENNVLFITKLKGLEKISPESGGWSIIGPSLVPWFYSELNLKFPKNKTNVFSNYDKYGINNSKQCSIFDQFSSTADILFVCLDENVSYVDENIKSLVKKDGKIIYLNTQKFMVPSKSALGLVHAIKNIVEAIKHV
jgi:uncharacterized glyoxalase superfamily protein PhnB